MRKRLYAYTLILILGSILSLLLPSWYTNPQSNLSSLVAASQTSSSGSLYTSGAGYLKFLPKSYVLVLYSGNDSSFGAVEYVTVSRLHGNLSVDLIEGEGPNSVRTLEGVEAVSFLAEHEIDVSGLDQELQRRSKSHQSR